MYIKWRKFYYESTQALIRILTYGFKKYILPLDFKLELKFLKTGMILDFISVNTKGSYNVRTHWMYLHIINIGLKMVW